MQPITIRIVTDASGVDAGINQAQGKVKGGMDKLMSVTGIGYAAMGAAAVGFAKQSIKAAMDAEKSQSRLEDAYKRFHETLKGTTLKDLEALADAQAARSRFDDDAIKDGIAVATQYGLTAKELEKLLPLIVDYAVKTGTSVPEAAKAVTGALIGTTRGLKGVGTDLQLTGDHTTDFALLYEAMTAKVAGASERDLGTAEGKMADLQAKWEDFQEQAGAPMLLLLTQLADALAPVIDGLTFLAEKYAVLQDAVAKANGPLGDFLKFLGPIPVIFGTFLDKLAEAPAQLGGLASALTNGFAGWSEFVGWIHKAIDAVGRLWDKLKSLASFGGLRSLVPDLTPWAALPSGQAQGAPVIATGTQAARVAPGAHGLGSAPLTINVNVHGNVGDPTQVGKRVVSALEAFVRTNGHRRVQLLTTPGP